MRTLSHAYADFARAARYRRFAARVPNVQRLALASLLEVGTFFPSRRERIRDLQVSEPLSVLQVFAVQHATLGFDG